MADEDFPEILAAARRGQAWACRCIWESHSPQVASFVRSRGSQDYEGLTSEVFLGVFQGLDQFKGGEQAFRAYIFAIARRRLADEFRDRARRPQTVEWTPADDPRCAPSAEHLALANGGAEWARELLASLSDDQREVLMLRVFSDMTLEDIASTLGKRVGAVKATHRRGLKALRARAATSRAVRLRTPYPVGAQKEALG